MSLLESIVTNIGHKFIGDINKPVSNNAEQTKPLFTRVFSMLELKDGIRDMLFKTSDGKKLELSAEDINKLNKLRSKAIKNQLEAFEFTLDGEAYLVNTQSFEFSKIS